MIIRAEKESEFDVLHELIDTVFKTAKVSNGLEAKFARHLRAPETYIPELALVAEEDGKLIGHVMLTRQMARIGGKEGEFLLLAPLSVLSEKRDRGVGSVLVNAVLELARKMGYRAVFLAGDPAYYGRFGFRASVTFGVKATNNIPEQYILALELVPGALAGGGTMTFDEGEGL